MDVPVSHPIHGITNELDSNSKAMAENQVHHSKEESLFAIEEGLEIDSEHTGASLSSSSASSPLPVDSLGPIFQIRGCRALADSSILTFRVSRLDDPENREKWWEIIRSYEDFEILNSQLVASQKFEGIIFPPLPPAVSGKYDDGFDESVIIHRKQIERFIQIVCAHPSLGRSQVLADFLNPSYTTPHDKSNRKGIFAKFAENFETKKAPVNRDIEEFFQNERDWSSNYSTQLRLVLNSVLTVIHSEKKITGQLKHLCTALSMNTPSCEETSLINHQLHSQMGLSFLGIKDVIDDRMQCGLVDFFCIWDLYQQYLQNEQAMLNGRSALLINYENANRNLDKAKAHKKDEAEGLKKAAEAAFEECSDIARHEIKAFHKQRVAEMRSNLTRFARNELEKARQIRASLSKALEQTRQFQIPADDLFFR